MFVIRITPLTIALIYVAHALPSIPLILAWRAHIKRGAGRLTLAALVLLTISYGWLRHAFATEYDNRSGLQRPTLPHH